MPSKPKQLKDASGASHGKRKMDDDHSEVYRKKRDRNNIAVKKSREKSKQKARETMEKVDKLKKENEDLEMKVKVLTKELSLLKELFLSHANAVPFQYTSETPKTEDLEKGHVVDLGSNGESDDSNSSCVESFAGAGPMANAEAVQKDHEYSVAPPLFTVEPEGQ